MLVDDAIDDLAILGEMLKASGIDVVTAATAEEALRLLGKQSVDLVVTDLTLPGASGLALTRALRSRPDPISVIVLTGSASVSHAIEALKSGACDYVCKPVDPSRLIALVRETLRSNETVAEIEATEGNAAIGPIFEGMLGASRVMQDVFARIAKVAVTSAPVLVVGESGTGKELVARALHNQSRRKSGPFVPVHTGAIPKELVASELFGHEKGAFTGAIGSSNGKFAAAEGGTLFLDEVGTMDLPTQISLLRVLESLRYTRVGGTREQKADVRIVAATNCDLLGAVDEGTFREDLYYRLNVFAVALPPLRERREDVPAIAERFLRLAGERFGVPARTLSPAAVERLLSYSWPGNIRELRNAMDQAAILARGETVAAHELELERARLPSNRHVIARPLAVPVDETTSLPDPSIAGDRESVDTEDDDLPTAPIDIPLDLPRPGVSDAVPSVISANALLPNDRVPTDDDADEEHPMVIRIQIGTPLAEVERLLILKTISAAGGNKQKAARILGISRRGLYVRLAAYGEVDRSTEPVVID
jgi:DNA-binding NtrC family response regulator